MKKISRLAFLLTLFLSAMLFGARAPRAVAQGNEQARITQVDSTNFPKVTVYVSVTGANGEPIGVDATRMTLYENGKLIKPDSIRAIGKATGQSEPLTTLLVIDVSGSMNENGKLEAAKNAARAYVEQMRPGDQVGVLAFNDRTQYVQPITADKSALNAAISRLSAQDNTAMFDALVQGVTIFGSGAGRRTIIVMTDGMDNRSTNNADNVISHIGPAGLTISTIGFGDPSLGTSQYAGIDEPRLKSLADRAGGLYAYANDAASLRKIYEQYARVLQNEYAITYTSLTNLRDGVNRPLTISLAAPSGAPISAQGKYNPGGVVPEVSKIPTAAPIFLIGLAALIALLLIPGIVTRAGGRLGGPSHGRRVRLTDPTKANGGGIRGVSAGIRNMFSKLGKSKKSSRVKVSEPSSSPPRVRIR